MLNSLLFEKILASSLCEMFIVRKKTNGVEGIALFLVQIITGSKKYVTKLIQN